MKIRELVDAIAEKHKGTGMTLNPPVSAHQLSDFEQRVGFMLPADFREFYSVCNGFGCNEDIFNMTPLKEISSDERHFGKNWFYFSEYMIYSDMWTLRINAIGQPEIVNASYPVPLLTSSLYEFLSRFLKGNVFDPGGLYEWQAELQNT